MSSDSSNEEEASLLKEEIEELESRVDNLESELRYANTRIDEQDVEIEELEGQVNKLKRYNLELEDKIDRWREKKRERACFLEIGVWVDNECMNLEDLQGALFRGALAEAKDPEVPFKSALEMLNELEEKDYTKESNNRRKMVKVAKQAIVDSFTRKQVHTWSICGKRLGVVKDIRTVVAKLIWNNRV